MSLPDEIEAFQSNIRSVPEIMALVNGVAEDAEVEEATAPTRFADPLSASLSLVAAAALWKLLNVGIDTLRRMSENAALEKRIQLIRELQEMDYGRQAPLIVGGLLEDMRERHEDDPVLKKLTEIFSG